MKKLRPNQDRAKYAIIAMYSMIALTVVELGYEYYMTTIVQFESIEAYDDFVQLTIIFAIIIIVISILAAILFIMWFRRAYYNLHQLVPRGLRYSEGWASGAWFIPVFNLWGPYQVAADLFRRSEDLLINESLTIRKPARMQIMGWWWGLWIASYVFGNIDARMDELIITVSLVSALLSISAAILAVKMIQAYHEMEVLLPQLNDAGTGGVNDDDLLDSGL